MSISDLDHNRLGCRGYRLQTCVLRANHVVPPRRNKAANRLRERIHREGENIANRFVACRWLFF